ncbi:MAG: glycosyltransferase, partial [Candidatus Aquirickettsiella sp.]
YASDALKTDREIVLAAIKQHGSALEKDSLILNIINDTINKNEAFDLEIVQVAPSLINKLNISKNSLKKISQNLYNSIVCQRKIIHLIWFGSLPDTYFTNLEEIVRNNPNYEIFLWINNAKIKHTLAVIHKSIISDELIRKITIKSFDRFLDSDSEMVSMLENVNSDDKETILKAYHLYTRYCSGVYRNNAGASDIARLILLAMHTGMYMDMDFKCEKEKDWSNFQGILPVFSDIAPVYIHNVNAIIYSNQQFSPTIMAGLREIISRNLNSKKYNTCRYSSSAAERAQGTVNLTGPSILAAIEKEKEYLCRIRAERWAQFFSSDSKPNDPQDARWREVPLKGHRPSES